VKIHEEEKEIRKVDRRNPHLRDNYRGPVFVHVADRKLHSDC